MHNQRNRDLWHNYKRNKKHSKPTLTKCKHKDLADSAAALSIQETYKGTNDENVHIENGQYRNEWYKRAENMVPQLDGTYNVSDDSDIDSHSYLDLASSNIIAHRM